MRTAHDVELRDHTSFRIGGRAASFFEPESLEDLRSLLVRLGSRARKGRSTSFFVLGGGTNTLVPDGDFDGSVISTSMLQGIRELDAGRLAVLPGTPLKRVIHTALRMGLRGLERMVGIPGTIGGAVFGNAGSRGESIGQVVESVLLFGRDGESRWVKGTELPWRYRSSGIGDEVIGEIVLRLYPGDRDELSSTAKELFNLKRRTQPLQAASAGCVFRNPPDESAGRLIEGAGLKGEAIGGARVSPRHANFIVNEGNATAADVESLIECVRERVAERYGLHLEREIISPREWENRA